MKDRKNMTPAGLRLGAAILIGIQLMLTVASVVSGGFSQAVANAASTANLIMDLFFFFFIGLVGVGALVVSFFVKKD